MSLETKIEEVLFDALSEAGYNIVRVKMIDGSDKILQIMLEKLDDSAITISDCKQASKIISAILDVEDLISARYHLEVSSPGIDRPLTKITDYIKFCGSEIKLVTFSLIDGRKRFKGMLMNVNDQDEIELLPEDKDKSVTIPFRLISSGNILGKISINKKKE